MAMAIAIAPSRHPTSTGLDTMFLRHNTRVRAEPLVAGGPALQDWTFLFGAGARGCLRAGQYNAYYRLKPYPN